MQGFFDMSELVGYARVSTIDQNLDLQIDALKNYGCKKIFVEKQSGSVIKRPVFQQCLEYLRNGDTLVVWKLDRIGRRAGAMLAILDEIKERGINFNSIQDKIDSDSIMGNAMIQIICVFSDMERNVIKERTKAGLEAARKKGNLRIGRPKKITDEDKIMIRALMDQNTPVSKIAEKFEVNPTTIWRAVGSKAKNVSNESVLIIK